MKCSENCASNWRLVSASLGVVFAIMVFFTFGFQYYNWTCAGWGLISGIWASLSLGIEITNKITQWNSHKRCLIAFAVLGAVGMALGLPAFPVYITYAAVEKHNIMPYGKSYWVVSVWCFMTFKHAMALFYSSIHYFRRQPKELEIIY